MQSGYGDDLAYIHAEGFVGFVAQAAPSIISTLRRFGIRDGLITELGCGSGVLAGRLVRAGYDVLGIDRSSAMIAMARRNAPGASFRRGSFLKIALPSCDAIVAVGEVFNYLFDADNS